MTEFNAKLNSEQVLAFLRLADVVNEARKRSPEGLLPELRQFEPRDVYNITTRALALVLAFEVDTPGFDFGEVIKKVLEGRVDNPISSEVSIYGESAFRDASFVNDPHGRMW